MACSNIRYGAGVTKEVGMVRTWWRHDIKTPPHYWPFLRGINQWIRVLNEHPVQCPLSNVIELSAFINAIIFNKCAQRWYPDVDRMVLKPQRPQNVIITSLLLQNDVVMWYWRNNDVIITPCFHWEGLIRYCFIEICNQPCKVVATHLMIRDLQANCCGFKH